MKKWLLLLVIFCLIPVFSSAQEVDFGITRLTLHLIDVKTGEDLKEFPVEMKIKHLGSGVVEEENGVTDSNGLLMYALVPGNWQLVFSADNQSTDVTDYFSVLHVYIQSNEPELKKKVYMHSVGAVEGVVYDYEGNLVSNADIGLKCMQDDEILTMTDNFGAFRAKHVPIGKCTVSAAFDDTIGSTNVDVIQGDLIAISINLDKNRASSGFSIIYFLIIVVIIAILTALFIFYRSKKSKGITIETSSASNDDNTEPKIEVSYDIGSDEKSSTELNPRARDVIETLNEKEKKIVEFLFNENNNSTQAAIRNGTGIPKTSLARDLQSLEKKRVILIERIGKMKKVYFTDWFLGKD